MKREHEQTYFTYKYQIWDIFIQAEPQLPMELVIATFPDKNNFDPQLFTRSVKVSTTTISQENYLYIYWLV